MMHMFWRFLGLLKDYSNVLVALATLVYVVLTYRILRALRRESTRLFEGDDFTGHTFTHCVIRTISASSTSSCDAKLTCCAAGNVSLLRMGMCK